MLFIIIFISATILVCRRLLISPTKTNFLIALFRNDSWHPSGWLLGSQTFSRNSNAQFCSCSDSR